MKKFLYTKVNEHVSTISPLGLALLDEVKELPNHPRQICYRTPKSQDFKKQKQKIPHDKRVSSSPPKKERSMFSRIATSVILIVLMWFGVFAWQNIQQEKTRDVQPTQNLVETSAQKSITTPQQPKIRTKGIEEFVIGERVLGKNPLVTEEERALFGPEPTPETHQGYVLLLPHEENDSVTLAQLLRPKDWLNDDFVQVAEVENESGEVEEVIFVWLELPEMGTVGWAELLGVVEFDQFTSGKGNLVTGTFCHLAPETIDLVIEDIDPIGCTPNHPFWSVDRQDYISAGELVLNERVLLYNGDTKRVINKLSRPGPEFVYNLEVFGEHVYHVTTEGVLVHNTCASLDLKGRIGKNKSIPKQAYRVLNEFAKTGELPKNFCPAHKFVDKFKQLPKNGNYMTLDIIREYPNQRGVRRIVVDLLSGKAWYTNNHYETFRRM